MLVRPQTPHTHPRGSEASIASLFASQRRKLLAALTATGQLRVDRVNLPGTTESVMISRPVDYDRLIDDAAADPEQNLPYWAELWPSGVALAATIALLSVQSIEVLSSGLGFEVFHDLPVMALIYFVYSLGFTLVLGLLGWGLLRALKLRHVAWYVVIGGLCGLLAASCLFKLVSQQKYPPVFIRRIAFRLLQI